METKELDATKKGIRGLLVDSYLEVLKRGYATVGEREQQYISNQLEKLVQVVRGELNLSQFKLLFDTITAKNIRTKTGLSLRALAQELGMSASNLCQFENKGIRSFGRINELDSSKVEKYLLWLKERGYNPYNI